MEDSLSVSPQLAEQFAKKRHPGTYLATFDGTEGTPDQIDRFLTLVAGIVFDGREAEEYVH